MLSDKLDRAISMHSDLMKERIFFSKGSTLSAQTPTRTTKIGIISSPSTITSMSKSWPHHNGPSLSDVLQGFLKPICLTWAHVHYNVTSYQVEVQVSIVECNIHKVFEVT